MRGQGPRELLASTAPPGLQVLSLLLTLWSVPALVRDEPLVVTVGQLVLLALLAVQVVLLARYADPVLRAIVRRPVASWLAGMAAIGAPVALMLLLTMPACSAPAWTVAVAGVALLAVGTALGLREAGRWAAEADPVRSPVQPTGKPERALTLMARATIWLVPAATLLLTPLTWLMTTPTR